MLTTILIIKDKAQNDVFLGEFATYELACAHAKRFFDDEYYQWNFYEIRQGKNEDILLKHFCSCQGGLGYLRNDYVPDGDLPVVPNFFNLEGE